MKKVFPLFISLLITATFSLPAGVIWAQQTSPPPDLGGTRPPVDSGSTRPPTDTGGTRPPTDTGGTRPPPDLGGTPTGGSFSLENPFKAGIGNSLFTLLRAILNDILMPIGGVIAVLGFIYAGFLYVKAQGKESDITKAHDALLWTSVGTAVLLGSWVLANAICRTINELGGPVCPA